MTTTTTKIETSYNRSISLDINDYSDTGFLHVKNTSNPDSVGIGASLDTESLRKLREAFAPTTTRDPKSFLVGESLRVTGNNPRMSHEFKLGETVKVLKTIDSDGDYKVSRLGGDEAEWSWVRYTDLEALTDQPGTPISTTEVWVVKTPNGEKYLNHAGKAADLGSAAQYGFKSDASYAAHRETAKLSDIGVEGVVFGVAKLTLRTTAEIG